MLASSWLLTTSALRPQDHRCHQPTRQLPICGRPHGPPAATGKLTGHATSSKPCHGNPPPCGLSRGLWSPKNLNVWDPVRPPLSVGLGRSEPERSPGQSGYGAQMAQHRFGLIMSAAADRATRSRGHPNPGACARGSQNARDWRGRACSALFAHDGQTDDQIDAAFDLLGEIRASSRTARIAFGNSFPEAERERFNAAVKAASARLNRRMEPTHGRFVSWSAKTIGCAESSMKLN